MHMHSPQRTTQRAPTVVLTAHARTRRPPRAHARHPTHLELLMKKTASLAAKMSALARMAVSTACSSPSGPSRSRSSLLLLPLPLPLPPLLPPLL
jgi:hypothetical protein